MAKTGRYYWVVTDFKIVADTDGEIVGFFGTRKSVPNEIIVKFIEPLYKNYCKLKKRAVFKPLKNISLGFSKSEKNLYGIH